MRNDYNNIERRVLKAASTHMDFVVYARRREGNFKAVLIILILADLTSFIFSRLVGNRIAFPLMLLVIYAGIFYIFSKRSGFGISYKSIIYCKFSNLLFRDLGHEEYKLEDIKYLDVRKGLLSYSFKMSCVSPEGKLRRISFSCPKFLADKSNKRYQENLKNLYERLTDLQKVLDKGDF